ncbi:MAG: hypothetical protein NWE83_03785 [Candidatus Bathyarchaeota archaeon]|nr:hypothetical protein [Candidatus Bathyarchaeota archaeon]
MLNLQRRVIKLQEEMVKKKLDLIVYGISQNFQYLTASAVILVNANCFPKC